jgi:hypothetical protein
MMSTATANPNPRFDKLDGRALFGELHRRSGVLAITGWIQLAILLGALALAPFDSRLVLGINPWIKPIKFALSITFYVWTVAWLLGYLRLRGWAKGIISWGISVSMLTEIACITAQAVRGTTSHYNVNTALDAAIFAIMGAMIAINSVLALVLLILFFTARCALPRPYLWSIRSGFAVFLAASAVGGVMVAHGAHSVGVKDGGPGLPIMNWSTSGGDLRAAHFLGLHALQVLPIVGFLVGRHKSWAVSRKTAYVLVLSGAYALLVAVLYFQAIHGSPLLRL